MIENRMVVDSEWDSLENIPARIMRHLPICECCGEKIIQNKALHIRGCKLWLCDDCIEYGKEDTGLEG